MKRSKFTTWEGLVMLPKVRKSEEKESLEIDCLAGRLLLCFCVGNRPCVHDASGIDELAGSIATSKRLLSRN
jgi:hypothetical protein